MAGLFLPLLISLTRKPTNPSKTRPTEREKARKTERVRERERERRSEGGRERGNERGPLTNSCQTEGGECH